MGAFNQLNGAIFDAGAIEARISAIDGKSIYNQRDGATLSMDSLARRLTALDGKIAVGQGGTEFDVDSFMRRLAAIEASVFSPLSFFAAGEQGVWYDPSDFTSMFQDSAGTTPVTASGQPVGKILDKSGRGNHSIQATAASRPILTQDASGYWYLNYDGVDDGLASAAAIAWANDKLTAIIGATSNSTGGSIIFETGPDVTTNANTGTFALGNGFTVGGDLRPMMNVGSIWSGVTSSANLTAPKSFVYASQMDGANITTGIGTRFVDTYNGGNPSDGTSTGGGAWVAGSLTTQTLNLGRRSDGSLFWSGRMYQLILRNTATATSAGDMTNARRFVGSKMGIAL